MFITLGELRRIIAEGLGWSSYTRNNYEQSVDLEPMTKMVLRSEDSVLATHLNDEPNDEGDWGPVPPKGPNDAYWVTSDPFVNDENVLPTPNR